MVAVAGCSHPHSRAFPHDRAKAHAPLRRIARAVIGAKIRARRAIRRQSFLRYSIPGRAFHRKR